VKIEINTDDGQKVIDMKEPKGKHIHGLWKVLGKAYKSNAEEDLNVDDVTAIMTYTDEITAELCNMSIEELNDLPISSKEKLTSQITEKAMNLAGFMKPSQMQENSTERAKPGRSKSDSSTTTSTENTKSK